MRIRAGMLAALGLIGTTGCWGLPGDAEQGDEANVTAAPRPHAEAVLVCEASFTERAGSSPSHDALADYADCLEAVDRFVQPTIRELVRQVNMAVAAQVDLRFEEYRSDGGALCELLGRTSSEPGRAEAGCDAALERLLADLIDAYVDLDASPRPIEEARDAHPDCYAAFDAAAVASEVDLRGATFELALCIEEETRLRRPLIAQELAESGLDNAVQLVDHGFDRIYEATRAACEIVSAASDGRGGSLARSHAATCRVDVAHRIDAIANGS